MSLIGKRGLRVEPGREGIFFQLRGTLIDERSRGARDGRKVKDLLIERLRVTIHLGVSVPFLSFLFLWSP